MEDDDSDQAVLELLTLEYDMPAEKANQRPKRKTGPKEGDICESGVERKTSRKEGDICEIGVEKKTCLK